MTPAERDEVRRWADETIDAHGPTCPCWACLTAKALSRYVPPSRAMTQARRAVERIDWPLPSGSRGRVLIDTFAEMTAADAHLYAHAIHAAADAAEES